MVIYKCCLSTDLAYAVQYDDIVSHRSTMCIKCCIVFCIRFYGMSAVSGCGSMSESTLNTTIVTTIHELKFIDQFMSPWFAQLSLV